MVLFIPCFGVSFCTVPPSVCLDDIYLGSGSFLATLWERAAHSSNRMFSLFCLFVTLVVSHFAFQGGTLVLIASVPGDCLSFTFYAVDKNPLSDCSFI